MKINSYVSNYIKMLSWKSTDPIRFYFFQPAFYNAHPEPLIYTIYFPLQFPFYSILLGWQRLFQQAKTVFYTWWRKPKPDKESPTGDLFEDYSSLLPCAN